MHTFAVNGESFGGVVEQRERNMVFSHMCFANLVAWPLVVVDGEARGLLGGGAIK